ncbi:MAG: hypothetical protein H6512_02040 [Acidimicrobiia bacterium]|nr:hypothetical protein [Acidimicrobiia bacterium]
MVPALGSVAILLTCLLFVIQLTGNLYVHSLVSSAGADAVETVSRQPDNLDAAIVDADQNLRSVLGAHGDMSTDWRVVEREGVDFVELDISSPSPLRLFGGASNSLPFSTVHRTLSAPLEVVS